MRDRRLAERTAVGLAQALVRERLVHQEAAAHRRRPLARELRERAGLVIGDQRHAAPGLGELRARKLERGLPRDRLPVVAGTLHRLLEPVGVVVTLERRMAARAEASEI